MTYNYIKPLSLKIPIRTPSLTLLSALKENKNNKNIYKIRFNNNDNNNDNEFNLYKYRLFTLKVCALFVYINFFLSFYPYY